MVHFCGSNRKNKSDLLFQRHGLSRTHRFVQKDMKTNYAEVILSVLHAVVIYSVPQLWPISALERRYTLSCTTLSATGHHRFSGPLVSHVPDRSNYVTVIIATS